MPSHGLQEHPWEVSKSYLQAVEGTQVINTRATWEPGSPVSCRDFLTGRSRHVEEMESSKFFLIPLFALSFNPTYG